MQVEWISLRRFLGSRSGGSLPTVRKDNVTLCEEHPERFKRLLQAGKQRLLLDSIQKLPSHV